MPTVEQARSPRAATSGGTMKKIVVRRTEAIKVTSAPPGHTYFIVP